MKKVLEWLKLALSQDGVPSYSRLASFMIVVATIAWVTYVVLKTGSIPALEGPTLFVTGGAGSQYAINQAKAVAASMKKDKE